MTERIRVRFLRPNFPRGALTPDNLEFWVGWQAQIDRLVRGLAASTNAHYLITGYPGVGKSSLVSRVISDWRRLCLHRDNSRILIFNLQFALPQSPEDIVRKLIGKVYFGSIDGQFSPNKQLAEQLQLTFIQAHSKSLKEVQSQKSNAERGGEVGLSLPKLPLIGTELKYSSKRAKEVSRSVEIQHEYNLSAAINDLESVIHFLTKTTSFKAKRIWPFRKKTPTGQPRVVFIFDQIDNLDDLQQLSTLFRIPNASFIVLGGIKLKEQISSAQDKGMQILDEFQEEYIACQWDRADQILSLLISEDDFGLRRFSEYCNYLNFFAQGLPRRIFAGIDTHTDFKDGEFYLQLTESEATRVRLCARFHRVLWKNRKQILGEYIDSVQFYLRDKALRGAYHLTDQIFRVSKFTYQQATIVATQLSDAIIHSERERVLRNLLRTLSDEGLIVNHGSFYTISESVLKLIKRIPNWLKDGFVDAHELLANFDTYGPDVSSVSPGFHLTHAVEVLDQQDKGQSYEQSQENRLPDSYKALHGITPSLDMDKYRIIRSLGRGGMGVVYLAEDKALKRKVALKVIESHVGNLAGFQERFLREGRIVAALQHPNIVQIYSMDHLPTGQIVLVTEYIEGDNLDALIKRKGRLPLTQAIWIGISVAKALDAAHKKQIIHRDVKPSNIILTNDDEVKLLDFGIAKFKQESSSEITEPGEVTVTGAIIGTPAFMSPEQMRGEPLDVRTDLYSLGVVLYEMVTGRLPFEGSTIHDLIFKAITEAPPSPTSLNPEVTPEVENIILQCLEKAPEKRFSSAKELMESLENVLYKQDRNSS